MIQEFVQRFDAARGALLEKFSAAHPANYQAIVRAVVEAVSSGNEYSDPDPERIVEIDHGSYQGTLVYVIGVKGYQPSDYWYVKVGYGSCSGCDTLEAIKGYRDEKPTEEQAKDYLTLALHIVQRIKKAGDESA
jgi:hypothetical protein